MAPVKRAYRHVPGVELTAGTRSISDGSQPRRFLLAMQNGTVSAEEFIGPGRRGLTLRRPRKPVRPSCAARGRRLTRRPCTTRPSDGSSSASRPARVPWDACKKVRPTNAAQRRLLVPRRRKRLSPLGHKAGARELLIETHDAFWFLAAPRTRLRVPKSFLTITPNARSRRTSPQSRSARPSTQSKPTLTVKPLSPPHQRSRDQPQPAETGAKPVRSPGVIPEPLAQAQVPVFLSPVSCPNRRSWCGATERRNCRFEPSPGPRAETSRSTAAVLTIRDLLSGVKPTTSSVRCGASGDDHALGVVDGERVDRRLRGLRATQKVTSDPASVGRNGEVVEQRGFANETPARVQGTKAAVALEEQQMRLRPGEV